MKVDRVSCILCPWEIIPTHLPELDERWQSTVERLIEVVFEALLDADHKCKWGQLTFTREGDWHHWICAISPTRKAVKLVIHKGPCWPIRAD